MLIGEGRSPLSAAGLMKRRLEVLEQLKNAPENMKETYKAVMFSWWDNYFDTGDGAVRHSDGRLKVVPDAPYLRSWSPETQLVDGAVPLSDDVYKGLEGEEFSAEQVERFFNKALSRRAAREHPGRLALARGDKALLGEFVDAAFAQAKERFKYDGDMMGVYHLVVPSEGAAGRLWFVARLLDLIYSSWAGGYDHLDDYDGRLVGVAPEALDALRVLQAKDVSPLTVIVEQAIRTAKPVQHGGGVILYVPSVQVRE